MRRKAPDVGQFFFRCVKKKDLALSFSVCDKRIMSNAANPTQEIANLKPEYSRIAGENVEIEYVGGTHYAFGTELAALRLYKHFEGRGRTERCSSLKCWYFTPSSKRLVRLRDSTKL